MVIPRLVYVFPKDKGHKKRNCNKQCGDNNYC